VRLVMKPLHSRAPAVLVLFLAVALAGCGKKQENKPPPPREVEVLSIVPSPTRETGEYLGALSSRQSVSVLPQVAGYVRKISVTPGQQVSAGAPLLEVDARQEAAALESAQAQQGSAQSNLELAQQTAVRTEALYKEGLASAQELERARAAVEAARGSARSASATVAQRRVQLQDYAVRAPFAGTVGDVLVKIGDFVNASTVLTTVAQADVLEVSIAVPAERARSIAPEIPLEILDSSGKLLLSSPIYFVAPQADPRTQLVEVKAVFRNTVGLRPARWCAHAWSTPPARPFRYPPSRWFDRAASRSCSWCSRRTERPRWRAAR
jgi:RND family efflux transporter MFP subunit